MAETAADAPPTNIERRLKIAIVAGLVAGLLLSPKLWFGNRLYPLAPIVGFLRPLSTPFDSILFGALLATLIAIALLERPAKSIAVAAVLAAVLGLLDQSRWQPWFYQYLIMLVSLGLYYRHRGNDDSGSHPALNTCRLVVVCTYFWSGLQKANADFLSQTFPKLLEPFTRSLSPLTFAALNSFGIAAPFFELAIGIGLLIRPLRRYAIFGAIAMHASILLALGPLGRNYNSVVWPWNVAMIAFLIILFWSVPNITAREILWPREDRFQRLALVLFGIAPALSFFNIWDTELSSALYAEIRNIPIINVGSGLAGRLPKELQRYTSPAAQPGMKTLNIWEWSMNELNVPVYPEPRIYKNVARFICSYAKEPSELDLIIFQHRVLFSPDTQTSYDCSDLAR